MPESKLTLDRNELGFVNIDFRPSPEESVTVMAFCYNVFVPVSELGKLRCQYLLSLPNSPYLPLRRMSKYIFPFKNGS